MYNVLLLCLLGVGIRLLGAKCLVRNARCETIARCDIFARGVCAVGISLFVCSYTVYVVYINMRLTVT